MEIELAGLFKDADRNCQERMAVIQRRAVHILTHLFVLFPLLFILPSNAHAQDRDALLQSAHEYLAEQEYELARQQFDLLSMYNSRDLEALIGLAICAYFTSDPDQAAYKLQRAADVDNEDARVWYWSGRIAYDRKDFESAWYNLNDAWLRDSLVGEIDFYRGASAYQVGLDSIAAQSLRRFTRQRPEHAYGQYYLGMSLLQEGRTEEALSRFNRAIEIDERIPRFHVGKGDAYAEMGDFILASIAYRAASRRNARYGEAWYRLSWSLYQSGQYLSAYEAGKKAADLLASDPDVLLNLARTAHVAGDQAEARRVLVDNQELIGRPNEANFLLGKIYAAMGDDNSAYILYSSVEEIDPGRDDLQFAWANSCFRLERFEEAADLYIKCLSRNPDDPLYTYNLGIVRATQGEVQSACSLFNKVLDTASESLKEQANEAIETWCGP